jgi:stage V sporulation protein G
MRISEVQIEFIKPCNGLIGFANLVFEDGLYLSSIAIHQKLNVDGYRLTYPSKGNFTLFYPIKKDLSLEIEAAIFSKLKNVMNKVKGNEQKI